VIGLWSVPWLLVAAAGPGNPEPAGTPAWRPRLIFVGLLPCCGQHRCPRAPGARGTANLRTRRLGQAPLGINLVADGLAVGMILMTTLVASLCALYARVYLRDYPASSSFFWPLLWLLWAGMNGIWLAEDIFNLYVGLEVMGLAAVGMVALRATPQALAAAMRYLLAALLGSLAYLLGVALLYASLRHAGTRWRGCSNGRAEPHHPRGPGADHPGPAPEDRAVPAACLAAAGPWGRADTGQRTAVGAGDQGLVLHPDAHLAGARAGGHADLHRTPARASSAPAPCSTAAGWPGASTS
jgi:hypothetical protein